MVDEVSEERLNQYSHIIDLSSKKTNTLVCAIEKHWSRCQLMLFDPRATMDEFGYTKHFFQTINKMSLNEDILIQSTDNTVFARDDIHDGVISRTCKVESWGIDKHEKKLPLVIRNKNAIFVNSYGNSDEVLRVAFSIFYARPMGTSILYGEGTASQRLEQSVDGIFHKNTLTRSSVNLRWPIPGNIDWYNMPDEVPEELFRFIFGLED
jgi:hypothetical protein